MIFFGFLTAKSSVRNLFSHIFDGYLTNLVLKKVSLKIQSIETSLIIFSQIFQLLVHSICAAEYSMAFDILKKVNPKEAEFLKEGKIPYKVRFRFGGDAFPPLVYFKVSNSHYYLCH